MPSKDLKRLHGEYWGALQSDPEMASALRDHQMLELANPDATSLLHATRNFSAISAKYMSRILKQARSWEKSIERDLDELYQQENA